MSVELTLEQYKAIQEGAETWLASTRTAYTCAVIARYLFTETISIHRTKEATVIVYPLFNRWLKATGKKPLYKFNTSFIETYLVNSGEYDDANVQELRTEFMTWIVNLPEHKFNRE